MTSKKFNDTIIKNLYSNDENLVLKAIDDLSENGNSDYIPALIDLLNTHDSDAIKIHITKILSELKHTNAVPLLVQAIEDNKLVKLRETLVRVCWENGLDYSNYFTTFVNLLINGDYMVAFEAYTVIDSSEGSISKVSSQQYIEQLKEALPSVGEERQTLIHHIIQFLPGLVRA
ncbi:MAG: HEAT repeat domain-containing protein [Prolixibacteraceae bacterium]